VLRVEVIERALCPCLLPYAGRDGKQIVAGKGALEGSAYPGSQVIGGGKIAAGQLCPRHSWGNLLRKPVSLDGPARPVGGRVVPSYSPLESSFKDEPVMLARHIQQEIKQVLDGLEVVGLLEGLAHFE
jgi:hypothetical protein